ncbi:putative transcription regulator MED7 family [Rosa chinensis]|uniref:Mediator of RNA polymerase II transcription subunit 7 n=1 Tax=Rosa chinensis TaxID=74649 RepID=A0A2P6RD17_ROSCH|nr:putative transcription regulator MED7 family [Rosa chinensis]
MRVRIQESLGARVGKLSHDKKKAIEEEEELLSYTADVLPSLEEQEVRQLYPKGPNIDFKKELRSLNRELQLHIFELADILVERPSQYARRVEEISLIFQNLHHRLNSLRPHQARVTLIHILELQTKRHKQAVEDIQRPRYY